MQQLLFSSLNMRINGNEKITSNIQLNIQGNLVSEYLCVCVSCIYYIVGTKCPHDVIKKTSYSECYSETQFRNNL